MGMGMRMRVGVYGRWCWRWSKSLVEAPGHTDPRMVHIMLHSRVHRVVMLRRAHRRSKARMERFVVQIEMSTGFDHIAHDTSEAQATTGLLLFALGRKLPVPRLNSLLLHRQRPVHVVELVVESAGIAYWFSSLVPSPKCRRSGFAVRAARTRSSCSTLQREASFWLDERPVLSVHLVVKTTSITEVVSSSIPPPQWR